MGKSTDNQLDIWHNEEWRDIPGYDGDYQVSSLGRIRSLKNDRVKILKQTIQNSGYCFVGLYNGGVLKTCTVHRIVCRVFHGNPPKDKPLALHKNDIKKDNRASNLYWGDHVDNKRDAKKNGRLNPAKGSRIGNAKLNEKEVLEIRYLYKNVNITTKNLADKYCVSQTSIKEIAIGKVWKHVDTTNCVTPRENLKGENNPGSKLTREDVNNIRRLYEKSDMTYKDLSKKYNVSQGQVCNIVNGKYWKSPE